MKEEKESINVDTLFLIIGRQTVEIKYYQQLVTELRAKLEEQNKS